MNSTATAELQGIVARQRAEIRRLERARQDLAGQVPAETLHAISRASTAGLDLVIAAQRVVLGVLK